MDILQEWLSFLTRWLHVMAGIAWVGTSFYFNWFDSSVRPSPKNTLLPRNRGTLNEIHGGSFYYHEQYWPEQHPERLMVHAWPAKTTFYSGLLLMLLIYWSNPSLYLVASLSVTATLALSIGAIVFAWFYYVGACRLFKNNRDVFLAMAVLTLGLAYLFTTYLNGRGAFISIGATLGALMGLNVIRHIVPNHIAMRRQLTAGETLNTHYGYLAKRHSQHNNYFTLPVVFAMLSTHFPLAYNHQYAFAILLLMLFAGWGIRHSLNVHYAEDRWLKALPLATLSALIAAIALSLQKPALPTTPTTSEKISVEQAMAIVKQRCTVCHAAQPTGFGFTAPPLGLLLENEAQVMLSKDKTIQRVLVTRDMPLGNVTHMTEAERAVLQQWLQPSRP